VRVDVGVCLCVFVCVCVCPCVCTRACRVFPGANFTEDTRLRSRSSIICPRIGSFTTSLPLLPLPSALSPELLLPPSFPPLPPRRAKTRRASRLQSLAVSKLLPLLPLPLSLAVRQNSACWATQRNALRTGSSSSTLRGGGTGLEKEAFGFKWFVGKVVGKKAYLYQPLADRSLINISSSTCLTQRRGDACGEFVACRHIAAHLHE
jgi:hypothetical protein